MEDENQLQISSPAILKRPLYIPNKTLMGAGPTNCSQKVLESLNNPILGHLSPECFQIMDEIQEGLKYLFQTDNNATLCISGSGHAGMETALCNLIEEGDVVLSATTGLWGVRAADIAKRYGAEVILLEAKVGCALHINEIELAIKKNAPHVFFIAHGDSSTGVLQSNLKEIGELCHKNNCLFVVDAVATLGGTDFYMDKWLIDVAYAASQKILGAPPGITPISCSSRAIRRIDARKSPVTSYYFDMLLLGQYWNCFELPRIYHHTISSTLLYGFREALAQICCQGLKAVIDRHQQASFRLQQGLKDMGLEFFVVNSGERLSSIITIKVPIGVNWREVIQYATRKYNLEINGGIGPTVDKVIRIGVMGENATFERADLLLNILNEALHNVKLKAVDKSKI